jgi:hypothetical protein
MKRAQRWPPYITVHFSEGGLFKFRTSSFRDRGIDIGLLVNRMTERGLIEQRGRNVRDLYSPHAFGGDGYVTICDAVWAYSIRPVSNGLNVHAAGGRA